MAMDEEDLAPRRMPAKKRDLGPMSVGEMQAYIVDLEEEIARVRLEIGKRERHRAGVEGLFKKS
jgi:uncharacterized small protein (DUF1192 family)